MGSEYNIWDITPLLNIKTELEPFTPENFSVLGPYNPHLSWNHSSEEDYITGYAIYRSIVNKYENPGTFIKISTVNSSTTSFIDYDLALGGTNKAYYKITAVNGTRESLFTNIIGIVASPYKNSSDNHRHTYSLDQNYPNPFNPTTKIKYSVPFEQNVKISLYDILGNEVGILMNEVKDVGQYELGFNSNNYSSGIYYYKMISGEFQAIHKLIIMK